MPVQGWVDYSSSSSRRNPRRGTSLYANPFGGFGANNPFSFSQEDLEQRYPDFNRLGVTDDERRFLDANVIAARQYEGLIDRQKGEFDIERSAFNRQLRGVLGERQAVARGSAEQEAGRRGLAFSGVEQAALANVEAQGARQYAISTAEFEGQLARLQQQERAMFTAGAFDFIRNIHNMNVNFDLEKQLLNFQAQLQADLQANQLWGSILGSIGTMGGFFLGGPAGAAVGGQIAAGGGPIPPYIPHLP